MIVSLISYQMESTVSHEISVLYLTSTYRLTVCTLYYHIISYHTVTRFLFSCVPVTVTVTVTETISLFMILMILIMNLLFLFSSPSASPSSSSSSSSLLPSLSLSLSLPLCLSLTLKRSYPPQPSLPFHSSIRPAHCRFSHPHPLQLNSFPPPVTAPPCP